jgi:hypothetical protein
MISPAAATQACFVPDQPRLTEPLAHQRGGSAAHDVIEALLGDAAGDRRKGGVLYPGSARRCRSSSGAIRPAIRQATEKFA